MRTVCGPCALLLAACWSSDQPQRATTPSDPPEKPKPVEVAQPLVIEKQPAPEDEPDPCGEVGGVPDGVVGGVVGDVPGGVIGGDLTAPPPPPPPPPPRPASPNPPRNIPPTLLEGNRIAGEKNIVPDDDTKVAIQQAGSPMIVGSWKLCVTEAGQVSSVTRLKSTRYPKYDAKIEREMRNWRYRPYLVNGKAAPVCTAVTFIYRQKPAAPPPAP